MGSILQTKNPNMPELYSFTKYQQTVKFINSTSINLSQYLNFILFINPDSLFFNFANWKLSTTKATVGLGPSKQRKLMEEGQGDQNQSFVYQQQVQLSLDMKQIFDIHHFLQCFIPQQNYQKMAEQNTPATPTQKGQKTCEICYDEQPDLALPCGHIFGAKCISAYIIQKQEKICPMCRRQFIGSRSSIERKLFTVVDNDGKYFQQEISSGLMQILKKRNEKGIVKIKEYLREKKGGK